MKKMFFIGLMLFAIGSFVNAQTHAVSTQKKQPVKPATSVSTVTTTTKKPGSNTKTGTATSTHKMNAATIGKHKRTHHKAAKKPAKKS